VNTQQDFPLNKRCDFREERNIRFHETKFRKMGSGFSSVIWSTPRPLERLNSEDVARYRSGGRRENFRTIKTVFNLEPRGPVLI
jgi:hypothetical protein